MRASAFKSLVASIAKLSAGQLDKLADAVSSARSVKSGLAAVERANPPQCRHCHSPRVVRNGHQAGLQRYRCKDCGKTCNAATATPLARLRHKERFERYAKCMAQGLSVREAAQEVGVCVDTAHRWRLRFLANVVEHQPCAVSGILEVDETYFRESKKGARVLGRPARYRGGGRGLGRGRRKKDWVPVLVGRVRGQHYTTDRVLTEVTRTEVTAALERVVRAGQTVVCTDGGSAFLRLERDLKVSAKSVVVSFDGHVANGVFHVQSANNYHERLKSWVNRVLRGVASKNLPRYLAWMRLRTWRGQGVTPEEIIASALGRQVINV